MSYPIIHVVLDASVLVAWLLPMSTKSENLQRHSKMLIEARIKHFWPSIRLYVPGIVAAETLSVLDRFHLCTWSGPVKKDPSMRTSKRAHSKARQQFVELVNSRRIEPLDHTADHVIATQLVSPINAKYQYRRQRSSSDKRVEGKRPIPQPMGAADCLIIGSAVSLGLMVGSENVVIATGDTRLADVVRKLRKLPFRQAKLLGLEPAAKSLGTVWTPYLYPRSVNLKSATDPQLASAFQGWPLPACRWVPVLAEDDISPELKATLIEVYREHKRDTGLGVDKLPYSQQIDAIRVEMVRRTAKFISNDRIYEYLSRWRKAGEFRKSGNPENSAE
jgi:PIN domain